VTKILTPAEVEVASAHHVSDAIRVANKALIEGRRYTLVNPGIADAVSEALRASGWTVTARLADGKGPTVVLEFAARPS
jgi:hypothetical protein